MTVFVSDTFTDTDGTALESHTPEVGGAWSKRSGSGTQEVNSNKLDCDSIFPSTYTNAATPGGAQYEITADVYISGGFVEVGVYARFLDANNYYRWRYATSGTKYELSKVVSGSITDLDSLVEAFPGSETATEFEILDATKKFYVSAAEKLTSADNALTDAGVVGTYFGGSTPTIDNFVANDTGAAAAENASMQPMHHWWPR